MAKAVVVDFTPDQVFDILLSFFQEKAQCALQENSLLASRFGRFCKLSGDITKFMPVFLERERLLKKEFSDSAARYERLFHIKATKNEAQRLSDEIQAEKRRIDELKGLAVLKKPQTKVASAPETVKADQAEYELSDLLIFLRWVISTKKEEKITDIFLTKAKQLSTLEAIQIVDNYRMIMSLESFEGVPKDAEYFEGLDIYTSQIPCRPGKVEDFIVEFELLINFWDIQTMIHIEHGQSFAYEVENLFHEKLLQQSLEATPLPYDSLSIQETEKDLKADILAGFNGSIGLDQVVSSLSAITGKSNMINRSMFWRLKRCDWLEKIRVLPKFSKRQVKYRTEMNEVYGAKKATRNRHGVIDRLGFTNFY
jgi:hypothetical protein